MATQNRSLFTSDKHHRRHRSRHHAADDLYIPIEPSGIDIRVGNRRTQTYYTGIRVNSARDASVFARVVDNAVRANPGDPLVMYDN